MFLFSIILTDLLLFRVGRDIIQAADFVRHYKHARFRHGRSLCASDFSRFGATRRLAVIHDALYDTNAPNAPNARFQIGNALFSDATLTLSLPKKQNKTTALALQTCYKKIVDFYFAVAKTT